MKKIKSANTNFWLIVGTVCFIMTCAGGYGVSASGEDTFPPDSQRFSLKLRATEAKDALRLLASQFKLNLVVSESVTGVISLDFDQVSFREAFNSVLKTNKLGYVMEGNIIRVDTLDNLAQEELGRADKKKLLEELESQARLAERERKEIEKLLKPMVTRTVKLKYLLGNVVDKEGKVQKTSLESFKNVLNNFLSGREDASIEIIEKTNTLVVTDIAESVDNVIRMAGELDVPTPQIRIEARIVEIGDASKLEFGVQWGGRYANKNHSLFQGTSASGGEGLSGAGTDSDGDGDSTLPVPLGLNTPAGGGVLKGAGGILGMTFGKWGEGLRFLDVNLSALEKEGKLKIISRPSILVMQNQNAEIHVGSKVPLLKGLSTQTGSSTGLAAVAEVEYEKIGIKLSITPQVTSENSIFMVVSVVKSTKGDQFILQGQPYDTIDTKEVFTQVVVKDGETLVIGGLFTRREQKTSSGLPYLAKLPYVGCLFGSYLDDTTDQELMIFITPKIVPTEPVQTASTE